MSSKILKISILNKLKKANATELSINTFSKKIDEIITKKYKMKEQLTIIKNYMSNSISLCQILSYLFNLIVKGSRTNFFSILFHFVLIFSAYLILFHLI